MQLRVSPLRNLLEMTVDKMTVKDLDRVMEIEAVSYPTPWSRRAFESELTENAYACYFVARHDGEIIGYVGMWVILDEAHITNIAVHPDHRRCGAGRMLLESMFERARDKGATKMTLEVRASNLAAQNLYRKLGFVARGIRKGYYTDLNEDAIVMWKDDLGPSKPLEQRVRWLV